MYSIPAKTRTIQRVIEVELLFSLTMINTCHRRCKFPSSCELALQQGQGFFEVLVFFFSSSDEEKQKTLRDVEDNIFFHFSLSLFPFLKHKIFFFFSFRICF